jgi:phage terminase large subunit-like protein
MTAAPSENLHRVIAERELRHPGDPALDRQVAAVVARRAGRGWRLDKLERESQIDAAVALAMAAERAQHRPAPAKLVGWL